jgi:hypothetical protein
MRSGRTLCHRVAPGPPDSPSRFVSPSGLSSGIVAGSITHATRAQVLDGSGDLLQLLGDGNQGMHLSNRYLALGVTELEFSQDALGGLLILVSIDLHAVNPTELVQVHEAAAMITSLDGYAEAAEGGLGTGADDQEVHTRDWQAGVRLDLELVEARAFDSGLIYARYRTR